LLSGDKQPSYKHFPGVGAFSLKFSIAQVWWGSWVAPAVDENSDVFCLSVCHALELRSLW